MRLPTPLLGLSSSSSALRSSLATAVSCSCSTVRSSSLITNLVVAVVREVVERAHLVLEVSWRLSSGDSRPEEAAVEEDIGLGGS